MRSCLNSPNEPKPTRTRFDYIPTLNPLQLHLHSKTLPKIPNKSRYMNINKSNKTLKRIISVYHSCLISKWLSWHTRIIDRALTKNFPENHKGFCTVRITVPRNQRLIYTFHFIKKITRYLNTVQEPRVQSTHPSFLTDSCQKETITS